MKKKVMALLAVFVLLCAFLTGCTEVYKVSNNISQEADNFNVTRKLTVLNARTKEAGKIQQRMARARE